MRLTTIQDGIIVENVEALIPHLMKQAKDYLPDPSMDISAALARRTIPQGEAQFYAGLQANFHDAGVRKKEWPKKAVEWALKADPRFAKDQKKKKSLDKSKAPFAKHILRWWLDPEAHSPDAPITMPEDIEIIRDNLKRLNVARQQGLHIQPDQLRTWEDVLSALEPFQEEGAVGDFYGEAGYGFPLVFHDGPWKVYHIDRWIDGDRNKNNGKLMHEVLQDYGWCTKYEGNFKSYSKRSPVLLVLLNNRVFASMNLSSKEFKNVQNRRKTGPAAADFVKRFFAANPDIYKELLLNCLVTRHSGGLCFSAGDFSQFLPELQDINKSPEIQKLLNNPETKEVALRSPDTTRNLAKLLGEWPSFEGWPEGRQSIIKSGGYPYGTGLSPYEEFVRAHGGRVPEIEADFRNPDRRTSMKDFMNYYTVISKLWNEGTSPRARRARRPRAPSTPDRRTITDEELESLTKLGEDIAIENARWVIGGYRGNPLPPNMIKQTLYQIILYAQMVSNKQIRLEKRWRLPGKTLQISPEIDKAVIHSNMPRLAFGWAKVTKPRKEGWPEAEPLIAQEKRSARAYEEYFRKSPRTAAEVEVEIKTPEQAVKQAITGDIQPELEELILTDLDQAIAYARDVIGPWPELEEALRGGGSENQIQRYREEVLYGEVL